MKLRFGVFLVFALLLGTALPAFAEEGLVNLQAIQRIESHGNPRAYNKGSGARGLFQVTPIVVKEWNNFHPSEKFSNDDMFNPESNEIVATWYLYNRIPAMLRYFGKPVTVRNVLISYNAGISYVVSGKELPEETSAYLQKYEAETR